MTPLGEQDSDSVRMTVDEIVVLKQYWFLGGLVIGAIAAWLGVIFAAYMRS